MLNKNSTFRSSLFSLIFLAAKQYFRLFNSFQPNAIPTTTESWRDSMNNGHDFSKKKNCYDPNSRQKPQCLAGPLLGSKPPSRPCWKPVHFLIYHTDGKKGKILKLLMFLFWFYYCITFKCLPNSCFKLAGVFKIFSLMIWRA